MSLTETINQDLKKAMLAKETLKISTLRMLKSAIMNAQINARDKALDDAAVLALISKQIKQRKDSATAYRDAGRVELADKEEAEIKLFEAYQPKQISDEALTKKIQAIIAQKGFKTKKDFGQAMRTVQESLKGQADNRRISSVLNKHLQ